MEPSPAGTAAPSPYASGGSSQATKYDRTMDVDAAFEGEMPPAGGGASRQHRQLFRVDSIAPMVAPVTTRRRVRSVRLPNNLRPYLSSPSLVECSTPRSVLGDRPAGAAGATGAGGIEEEEKFPLPDNPDIWAHYGFIDKSLIRERHHRDDASSRGSGRRGGGKKHLVRLMSDPGGGRRQDAEEGREGAEEPTVRDYPACDSTRGEAPAAASPTGSDSHTALRSNSAAADVGRPRPGAGPRTLSSELGSTTPPTVILTPSSQERCKPTEAAATAATAGGTHTGLALDSMAAAAAGAAAAAAAAATAASAASEATASPAATPVGKLRDERAPLSGSEAEASQQLEETKDEELMALRQEEEQQQQGHHHQRVVTPTTAAVATDPASSAAALARASRSFSSIEAAEEGARRVTQQAGSADKNAARRRPPRSMAEVERHKRNRAERLRAYGCQRTLYPRIVPGSTAMGGGGSASGSASGSGSSNCPVTEEMETALWVDTLRVCAALRGESLMAACTVSFVESTADTLLQERQSEARASRTADVSEMEGPDGLLHCSVLKGDHALAARAAQFLVDKRGASVNSRDAWGRTPLHTAAGKGMVAMARFFVRRGADVDSRDQDDRTPLFFACAGGHTTMARYLTRIEVGARVDLRDSRGLLAGEYFWEAVEQDVRDEIMAILVAAGWPDPPPPRDGSGWSRSRGVLGQRSRSVPPPKKRGGSVAYDRGNRQSEGGGDAGMKRLASEMKLLMKRR